MGLIAISIVLSMTAITIMVVFIGGDYLEHKGKMIYQEYKIGSFAQFLEEFDKYPWRYDYGSDCVYLTDLTQPKWHNPVSVINSSRINFNGNHMVLVRLSDYLQFRLFLLNYLHNCKKKVTTKALQDKWGSDVSDVSADK